MDVNLLGVCHKVRDFKPLQYWRDKIDQIDILYVENYDHEEAHRVSRQFFLDHDEYTHYLFICDDVLVLPSHIDLVIEDVKIIKNAVICGYSNIDFKDDKINISFKDLRKIYVMYREQYQHPSIYDVLANNFNYPFVQVFFHGNTLACYPRDIIEKLSFKPYKYEYDDVFGKRIRRGKMFDLQMCIELANMGIPILCDLRLLCMHFGNTLRFINVVGKEKKVWLKKKG